MQYSPINQLPIELLLYVFHYSDPGVKHRLQLTHICKIWREIAIAGGSLWTSVDITPDPTASNERFNRFISLLDLQLERSHNFPLYVVWHIQDSGDRNAIVLKHIRHYGPFHRWKSLTISSLSACDFLSTDGFPNLESIVILPYTTLNVIRALNLTTTSKLRTLDASQSSIYDENVDYFYGPMLSRITRLVLSSTNIESRDVKLPPFPANIIDLEANSRRTHPFPYVETYKLTHGSFQENRIIDLQRLTNLIVTSSFNIHKNCRLFLPSLRRLVCATISLGNNAILDAPQLEALEFRDDVEFIPDMTQSRYSYIKDLLAHQGYLLSPTKSLSLDVSLPPDLILTMLTRHSRLETLQLRFNADFTVWKLTVALISSSSEQAEIICPQLTEIRVGFARGYRGFYVVEWWRDQAAQIVKGRRGLSVVLHFYGEWEERETFTQLA